MKARFLNGAARPVDGRAALGGEDQVDVARQSVMALINKLMTDASAGVPVERRTDLVEDIALFAVFMASVKGAEFAEDVTKPALIKRMRAITNRIEAEVPEQLLEVVNAMGVE